MTGGEDRRDREHTYEAAGTKPPAQEEEKVWAGTTIGTPWMHRTLIKWLRATDIRVIYWFTYIFVIIPSIIYKRREARQIHRFYRKGFGYGRMKAMQKVFANYCAFGRIVIDRFAMYAGKKYEIELDGYEHFDRLAKSPGGFVQLSVHIGNYELAGYTLQAKEKRFNALVYGGEKETVMDNRSRMFSRNNIRMIPLKGDMSHIYVVNQALADGEIMSVPADRIFGSKKVFTVDFLGHKADFPQGPFQIAAIRDVPVIFVAVMKTTSRKYRIIIRPVAEAGSLQGKTVKARAKELAERFVPLYEEVVREYPEQWFNYYDFWATGDTAGKSQEEDGPQSKSETRH